ncbi:hypothetical protein OBBRIDRAFT_835263 [Obba rivulosa]|uniref:Uncharacterized protein n=1 Tax=Obba rivulosa TaxID=1052685 RepID=A0A8E2AT49_9APHY|nr:hypothetical protein OBBRIDRAFT_835263 [Obba rivulosa]
MSHGRRHFIFTPPYIKYRPSISGSEHRVELELQSELAIPQSPHSPFGGPQDLPPPPRRQGSGGRPPNPPPTRPLEDKVVSVNVKLAAAIQVLGDIRKAVLALQPNSSLTDSSIPSHRYAGQSDEINTSDDLEYVSDAGSAGPKLGGPAAPSRESSPSLAQALPVSDEAAVDAPVVQSLRKARKLVDTVIDSLRKRSIPNLRRKKSTPNN